MQCLLASPPWPSLPPGPTLPPPEPEEEKEEAEAEHASSFWFWLYVGLGASTVLLCGAVMLPMGRMPGRHHRISAGALGALH